MMRVALDDLQSRKLMIATPMYGAQCFDAYVTARDDLREVLGRYGMGFKTASVRNDSCIARARNTLVDEFLRSDCTHLLFWDADIVSTPDDGVALLALADPKSDKDVVCGLYPKKHIRWDKVSAAVRQGIAAEDLGNFVGDSVFNPIGLTGSHDLYTPMEVAECGTGFMMIQRHVFERFAEAYPDRAYRSVREGQPGWNLCAFMDEIDPESRRFLTEDYNFCRLVRAIGLKVWVAPWINLSHIGNYTFTGNPAAVSSLVQPISSAA